MTLECSGCVCNECKKKYKDECGRCHECGWKEDDEPSFCQEYDCDEIEKDN